MADQALHIDGYTPAVVTAASAWVEAAFVGVVHGQQVDGYVPAVVNDPSRWRNADAVGSVWPIVNFFSVVPTTWSARVYKMRGMDAAVDGLYDTWLVEGEPDTDASEYTGELATPLRDVIVIDTWST